MASSRPSTGTSYNSAGHPHQHDGAHEHHGGEHEHHHGIGHSHIGDASIGSLRIALTITAVFLVIEVVGGYLANSIALLADAGHMLTDVAALGLALFVAWFSRQPGSPQKTYGYLRWEILAAFVNGGTLLLISAGILVEAIMRLRRPEAVGGGLMLGVAVAGLAANLVSARVLAGGSRENLNTRAAYLHVLGDLLATIGTIIAALLIRYTGWLIADPIASILTTVLIMGGAWRLVRESVDILLESTPAHIPMPAVRSQLEAIPGIESVHDVHVWAVTPAVVAMSAHCIVREPDQHQHVLEHIHDAMRLFGIQHVTIQLERDEMLDRERHLHA
jgi:cobalt-zinc-cadmium efflux system protein